MKVADFFKDFVDCEVYDIELMDIGTNTSLRTDTEELLYSFEDWRYSEISSWSMNMNNREFVFEVWK